MTYTINPNAKNVWIRDNEDTMDLSPITDASSVYLENGRTLEQELGEGSMVSNIATVDNSMTKVIDGTLDGAYESCVLKGRSLVNCVEQSMFKPMYTSRVETEGGFIYTQTEYQVATRLQFDYTQYSLLNNNTYYLISFELKVNKARILNIITDGTGYEGYGLKIEENTHVLIRQKIKFSPNGTVLRIYVRCKDGIDYTNDTFTLKNLMLIPYQEGMENWDIPYFEGMCDVKMPILRNVGKNLANQSKYEIEAYVGGNDGVTVAIGAASKNTQSIIMEIEPNVSIVASSSSNSDRKVLACFNHFPTNGSKATKKTNNGYITTDTDTKYVMYYYNSDTVANGIVSQVQIEESPSPTQYEPHKTNILHTPEEIVLRSLPNGVKDTYNVITGEYVKRIGEIVLDGSEGWLFNTSYLYAELTLNDYSGLAENKCINNRLPQILIYGNESSLNNNRYGLMIGKNKLIRIRMADEQSGQTSDGIKQYLSQNPITVQYELATPVTKTVSPIGVPFAYENGHVILESGYDGQSLLPTLEYSTVVNKTGQVQSVAKTIMKQEEQLSSLEKMLVQSIVEMDYNNTLLTLNLEIDEVM